MTAAIAAASHSPRNGFPAVPFGFDASRLGSRQTSESVGNQNIDAEKTKSGAYGTVETDIHFLSKDAPTKKGELYFWNAAPPEGQVASTVKTEPVRTSIQDLRSLSPQQLAQRGFTTDGGGFEVLNGFGIDGFAEQWKNQETANGFDDAFFEKEYYPEIKSLLTKRFGAKDVFIFDHTVRKRDPTVEDERDPTRRQPVARAHIDQSEWAGLERVRIHLGEELYERIKSGDTSVRVRLINVWRPLRDNVDNDWPLAVGDYRTFNPSEDLIVSELRYPDRTGETLAIRPNEKQEYWYLSGQKADEALLLQCYDSKSGGAKTPHTAFEHPGWKQGQKYRWSVEVRTLVVTEE